eukprot:scaffold52512_cov27-Tisochrysis_lutea.AAC.3
MSTAGSVLRILSMPIVGHISQHQPTVPLVPRVSPPHGAVDRAISPQLSPQCANDLTFLDLAAGRQAPRSAKSELSFRRADLPQPTLLLPPLSLEGLTLPLQISHRCSIPTPATEKVLLACRSPIDPHSSTPRHPSAR